MSPSDFSNSDKGPMLETSALETHYGGQFTSGHSGDKTKLFWMYMLWFNVILGSNASSAFRLG